MRVVVYSLAESLAVQNLRQHALAPVTLRLVPTANDVGEPCGSVVDAAGLLAHLLQLLRKRRRLLGRLAIGLLNGALQLVDILLQRVGKGFHRLGVLRFQLNTCLVEQPRSKVGELLLNGLQLLFELLFAQGCLARILLLLSFQLRLLAGQRHLHAGQLVVQHTNVIGRCVELLLQSLPRRLLLGQPLGSEHQRLLHRLLAIQHEEHAYDCSRNHSYQQIYHFHKHMQRYKKIGK